MQELVIKTGGLLLIAALGFALKRAGVFREQDAKQLSRIIIYLTLPGALIGSFASFSFEVELVSVILTAAAANCLLLAAATVVSRGRDNATRALYMLNTPSYNIGTFVLPLVQSLLPPSSLLAVSMFDAGNNPVNSGGAYAVTTAVLNGERIRLGPIVKRMLHSVPFDTFLVLIVTGVVGLRFPAPVYSIAAMFGQANSFLAMLMIGIMFEIRVDRADLGDALRIIGMRYGFGLCAAALCGWLLPAAPQVRMVTALAMLAPVPSVTLAYCEKCGCKPSLVGLIHSLCIPISLALTFGVLCWWQVA